MADARGRGGAQDRQVATRTEAAEPTQEQREAALAANAKLLGLNAEIREYEHWAVVARRRRRLAVLSYGFGPVLLLVLYTLFWLPWLSRSALVAVGVPGLLIAIACCVAAFNLSRNPGGGPKIVVLTTFERDHAVAAALRAGADGYIMKDTTPEFVLAAIRTVHAGHAVVAPRDTAALLRDGIRPARPEAIAALSAREKEVFLLAARGLSNAEAGQAAFISEATVKSHMRSILQKLGLTSRVQLVAFAHENGLVR